MLPSFVYIVMDDFWLTGGDSAALPQTTALVGDAGASFTNFFVSSPKCTPSRSSFLTGRYYHNLRPHGATSGRGLNTTSFASSDALFPQLHAAGYLTGVVKLEIEPETPLHLLSTEMCLRFAFGLDSLARSTTTKATGCATAPRLLRARSRTSRPNASHVEGTMRLIGLSRKMMTTCLARSLWQLAVTPRPSMAIALSRGFARSARRRRLRAVASSRSSAQQGLT